MQVCGGVFLLADRVLPNHLQLWWHEPCLEDLPGERCEDPVAPGRPEGSHQMRSRQHCHHREPMGPELGAVWISDIVDAEACKPLHDNLVRHLASGNPTIIHEYNLIRRRILKVMREIHRASESDFPLLHIRKLEKQRQRAEELDALRTGRINRLLLENRVTSVMATSLINDSEEAAKIVQSLIDIAALLYFPRDKLVHEMEAEMPAAS